MSYAFTQVTISSANEKQSDDGGLVVAFNDDLQTEDGTVILLTTGNYLVVDETPEEIFNSVVFVSRPEIAFGKNTDKV